MINPETFISSVEGQDTLLEAILAPSFTDKVPDFYPRISIVASYLVQDLVKSADLDLETATNVAAKAVRGMLAATAITLDESELTAIFAETNRLIGLLNH